MNKYHYEEWSKLPRATREIVLCNKNKKFVVVAGDNMSLGDIVVFVREVDGDGLFRRIADDHEQEKAFTNVALLPNQTNLMQSLKDFFKNLTLSADEKLLLERGLEDPSGIPSKAYEELAMAMLCADLRPRIIELAKKQKEEEDKNKE